MRERLSFDWRAIRHRAGSSRLWSVIAAVAVVTTITGFSWIAFFGTDSFPRNAASKKPYIEALVMSAHGHAGTLGSTPQMTRCVAAALVHGYGVGAFAEAGLGPAALRRHGTTLDALDEPTPAQVTAIGREEQLCGKGPTTAGSLLGAAHVGDARVHHCLSTRFARDPHARAYLVYRSLGRPPDLMAAHSIVMAAEPCIQPTALALGASGLRVTGAEFMCITHLARGSAMRADHMFAESLTGHSPTRTEYLQLFNRGVRACVSPARRARI